MFANAPVGRPTSMLRPTLDGGTLVPGGGVEPPRPEGRRILSPNPFVFNIPIRFQLQALAIFRCAILRGFVQSCSEGLGRVRAEQQVTFAGDPNRQLQPRNGEVQPFQNSHIQCFQQLQ
jgi:hypothetical protein